MRPISHAVSLLLHAIACCVLLVARCFVACRVWVCRMFSAVHVLPPQVEARTLGQNCEVILRLRAQDMPHRMAAVACRRALRCTLHRGCDMLHGGRGSCVLCVACCMLYLLQIIASNIDDHNSFLLEATEIISILGLSDGPTPTLTTVTLLP